MYGIISYYYKNKEKYENIYSLYRNVKEEKETRISKPIQI